MSERDAGRKMVELLSMAHERACEAELMSVVPDGSWPSTGRTASPRISSRPPISPAATRVSGKAASGQLANWLTGCHDAYLVGDLRESARQPRVNGRTRGMKKVRFARYCGLVLEWGANAAKFAYYALKFLGEVTNYRAQSV